MSNEDEELKKKYKELYYKLIRIRSELKDVYQVEKSLYRKSKNTIKINHLVAENDLFSQINDKHIYVSSQLNSTISRVQSRM